MKSYQNTNIQSSFLNLIMSLEYEDVIIKVPYCSHGQHSMHTTFGGSLRKVNVVKF